MKIFKIAINIILLLSLILIDCKKSPHYNSRNDLIGNWQCDYIEISIPHNNEARFAIQRYGYASISLNEDSSYSFNLNIIRDVDLEKIVLGNSYSKTIIQAGYKEFRRGYYTATNNNLTFYDANRKIINNESYFFNEKILVTKFINKENKFLKFYWVKEN